MNKKTINKLIQLIITHGFFKRFFFMFDMCLFASQYCYQLKLALKEGGCEKRAV
jgi:hypothetical protein